MKCKSIMAAVLGAAALCGLSAQAQETWKDLGTGLLRDDIRTDHWLIDDFYEFPVQVQESEQTPGRYRLVNAYEKCPLLGPAFPAGHTNYLVIDASDPKHVFIEQGGTNYFIGGGQHLIVWSVAEDYFANQGNWNLADQEGVCGSFADGVITFPRNSILYFPLEDNLDFTPFEDPHSIGQWRRCNHDGMFRLLLPGVPEYDVKAAFNGINTAGDGVEYTLTLDKDVTAVRYALFSAEEYTDDMAAQIRDDKVEYQTATASGKVTVPYSKDGIYTFVAVPYVNDKAWTPTHITREWAYSQDEWKNIGDAIYTEALLSSNDAFAYSGGSPYDEEIITVPVQQNVEKPWLFRLVDAYAPGRYRYATESIYNSTKKHYIEIDCGLFDNVRVLHNNDIGLKFMRTYIMGIWSYADRNVNDEAFRTSIYAQDLRKENEGKLPTGHYDKTTGTITFDKKALIYSCSANPNATYPANLSTHAKIQLPKGVEFTEDPAWAGIGEIEAAGEEAPAEYFTIDGVRVADLSAPGVYIVRKGAKTFKTIVK